MLRCLSDVSSPNLEPLLTLNIPQRRQKLMSCLTTDAIVVEAFIKSPKIDSLIASECSFQWIQRVIQHRVDGCTMLLQYRYRPSGLDARWRGFHRRRHRPSHVQENCHHLIRIESPLEAARHLASCQPQPAHQTPRTIYQHSAIWRYEKRLWPREATHLERGECPQARIYDAFLLFHLFP